ncbi:MAG: glucose-1-phosphate cytidylyltransferase [Candidatus Bathyarchaeota archaeon]|nr:MAG: glucose-1-phosphate cytidylyltransferase [Candidatus Bathyarchaeota archaeon]
MKVAILAGGLGTRLIEETTQRPKPMVEIGGHPILWHIMMHYSRYGFNEFVIALGYKGEYIKNWMREYYSLNRDMTVKTKTGDVIFYGESEQDWIIHLVDTGPTTQTGGRIKRLAPWLDNETFMLTWGDGVSDVALDALLRFHRSHGRLATLTAVRPPSRFGHLTLDEGRVVQFKEKPLYMDARARWINGAFFVLEPNVFDYIEGDNTQFEKEPLERLANDGQLMAYCHTGFWQCMDTLAEKIKLEKIWQSGKAPWKTWDQPR